MIILTGCRRRSCERWRRAAGKKGEKDKKNVELDSMAEQIKNEREEMFRKIAELVTLVEKNIQ
jgi:hypothetical protein